MQFRSCNKHTCYEVPQRPQPHHIRAEGRKERAQGRVRRKVGRRGGRFRRPNRDGRTDAPADRPSDGPTDRRTEPPTEQNPSFSNGFQAITKKYVFDPKDRICFNPFFVCGKKDVFDPLPSNAQFFMEILIFCSPY